MALPGKTEEITVEPTEQPITEPDREIYVEPIPDKGLPEPARTPAPVEPEKVPV